MEAVVQQTARHWGYFACPQRPKVEIYTLSHLSLALRHNIVYLILILPYETSSTLLQDIDLAIEAPVLFHKPIVSWIFNQHGHS